MEFLTNNYIWIIVVVVVILMTIIGYIAEKTNFGKKEFSKKKTNKGLEEKKEEIKVETKRIEEPKPTLEPVSKFEEPMETFETPNRNIEQVEKRVEKAVQFSDPLADDMNVASETLEKPYQETRSFPIEEDLNVPFGENASYNASSENSFDVAEDLNAPFGDLRHAAESVEEENLNVPLTDELSYDSSYDMPAEDLNAPFGDNVEVSTRDSFNLDLPDIDSIKEDVNTTIDNENDDDDIWKF